MSKKIINAGTWAIAGQFTKLLIKFSVSIILARILSPKEFGLLGMVSVLIAILTSFNDLGLFTSLIQKKDVTQKDLSSVFWLSLLLSLFIAFTLFLSAPLITYFYKEEQLTPIIKVLSLIFIFNSLIVTHNAILSKELNFKRMEVFTTISAVLSSIIALILAYNNFSVWALVYQQLLNSILNALLIWSFEKWRPSFVISKQSLQKLLGFGVKVFSSSILNTLFGSIDSIVIGKYFNAATLGLYSYAQNLINVSVGTFTNAIVKVLFPAMAEAQSDFEKLKNTYIKSLNLVNLFIIPAMGTIAIMSKEIIIILINDKWLPMVPYIQIFSIIGILYPVSALNINLLLAKGRADKFLYLEIVKKILLVAGIGIGYWFGIMGILYGILVISIIGTLLNLHVSGKVSGYLLKDQLYDMLPILLLTTLYLILLLSLKLVLIPHSNFIIGSIGSLLISATFFFFCIKRFIPNTLNDILKIINSRS